MQVKTRAALVAVVIENVQNPISGWVGVTFCQMKEVILQYRIIPGTCDCCGNIILVCIKYNKIMNNVCCYGTMQTEVYSDTRMSQRL